MAATIAWRSAPGTSSRWRQASCAIRRGPGWWRLDPALGREEQRELGYRLWCSHLVLNRFCAAAGIFENIWFDWTNAEVRAFSPNPAFAKHMEALVMSVPDVEARLEMLRQRFRPAKT